MNMSDWWRKNRREILRWAGTFLAIALLVLLLRDNEWKDVIADVRELKRTTIILVIFLFFLSRISTALRWHVLLYSAGMHVRLRDTLSLTFTGLFASNFLPTTIGGDVARLAGTVQLGFDRAISLASLVADRLIGMFGMSLLLPLGVKHSWALMQKDFGALVSLTILQRMQTFIQRTASIFRIWLKKPLSLLVSLLFTFVHMVSVFFSIYLLLKDLGNEVPFFVIGGLWSITYFVTLVPISINGYGLQELSFTFFMANVAGIPQTVSLAVAVLIRACFILTSLPGAFFLPSILSVAKGEQEESLSMDLFL